MFSCTPNQILAILNGLTGAFSAAKGLIEARKQPSTVTSSFTTSNPWLYVFGGLATIGVGVLNWTYPQLGALGTVVLIAASLYNAWFGAAKEDWRFWTLNLYSIASSILAWLSV
jgi:hypothetical protein